MIRVLICDDHAIVRAGLAQVLSGHGDLEVVAEADSGSAVIRTLRSRHVDILLLDIALPNRDGLDVLKQLRTEFPGLPVLMLSTYPESQYATRCLKLGAHGYLNKSADPDLLLSAVRKVAAGGSYVSPEVAESLALSMRRETHRFRHETLSRREYQVFSLISSGRSLADMAASLNLSPNTVSTYRARVMEKLGTQNDVETALYAMRHRLLGDCEVQGDGVGMPIPESVAGRQRA